MGHTKSLLAETHPHLLLEWNPENTLDFLAISTKSNKKALWLCKTCQYGWDATICSRSGGAGCPKCSGKVLTSENSLVKSFPAIASQFHPTKNAFSVAGLFSKSAKKVWWQCGLGHEWQAVVCNRTLHNQGCPFCANRKVLPGFNDLATVYPEIAKQWHPTKNNYLLPSQVLSGSAKKVWWQCSLGHEWEVGVVGRVVANSGRIRSCPFCSNNRLLSGFNDLATVHPDIADQWHPTKNGVLTPDIVLTGSHRKVWWVCDKQHEWEAEIAGRIAEQGCGVCFGNLVSDDNNLLVVNPELATEFDEVKNFPLTAGMVRAGLTKKVWWLCEKGHSFHMTVYNRHTAGQSCVLCSEAHTSRMERKLGEVLTQIEGLSNLVQGAVVPDVVWGSGRRLVVDFLLLFRGERVVVEYDGLRWHSGALDKVPGDAVNRDTLKTNLLLDAGFKVVRVRETVKGKVLPVLPVVHDNLFTVNCEYDSTGSSLPGVVDKISVWLTV